MILAFIATAAGCLIAGYVLGSLGVFRKKNPSTQQVQTTPGSVPCVSDLGNTLVREVMVPRTEVVHLDQDRTLRQALALTLRSGFSRIPVTSSKGLDDVVGILYLKDVVKRVFDNSEAQSSELVSSLVRPVTWCPDSKAADVLLREMQAAHIHMVVVVDEFGGTSGVITIEDLIEEIVGEIQDEFDQELDPVTEITPGVYRVSSRLSLSDLGELFGRVLHDEDVDSVGGILAKELNMVPIPGSTLIWEGLELKADQFAGRRHQMATVLVRQTDMTQTTTAEDVLEPPDVHTWFVAEPDDLKESS
ncbi:MAG: hemolysin family protein [Propionibacteriaceae bacterium]|jgi:CBS domain containing-hemolysin-like protein|nr:hemolysin family protein [Propionibacteriaceae bacterium]